MISINESVSWLEDMTHETFTEDTFTGWIKEGSKKLTIDDETNFCDPNLLRNVLNSKVRKNSSHVGIFKHYVYLYSFSSGFISVLK